MPTLRDVLPLAEFVEIYEGARAASKSGREWEQWTDKAGRSRWRKSPAGGGDLYAKKLYQAGERSYGRGLRAAVSVYYQPVQEAVAVAAENLGVSRGPNATTSHRGRQLQSVAANLRRHSTHGFVAVSNTGEQTRLSGEDAAYLEHLRRPKSKAGRSAQNAWADHVSRVKALLPASVVWHPGVDAEILAHAFEDSSPEKVAGLVRAKFEGRATAAPTVHVGGSTLAVVPGETLAQSVKGRDAETRIKAAGTRTLDWSVTALFSDREVRRRLEKAMPGVRPHDRFEVNLGRLVAAGDGDVIKAVVAMATVECLEQAPGRPVREDLDRIEEVVAFARKHARSNGALSQWAKDEGRKQAARSISNWNQKARDLGRLDQVKMPFGAYKGKTLAELSAAGKESYLAWLAAAMPDWKAFVKGVIPKEGYTAVRPQGLGEAVSLMDFNAAVQKAVLAGDLAAYDALMSQAQARAGSQAYKRTPQVPQTPNRSMPEYARVAPRGTTFNAKTMLREYQWGKDKGKPIEGVYPEDYDKVDFNALPPHVRERVYRHFARMVEGPLLLAVTEGPFGRGEDELLDEREQRREDYQWKSKLERFEERFQTKEPVILPGAKVKGQEYDYSKHTAGDYGTRFGGYRRVEVTGQQHQVREPRRGDDKSPLPSEEREALKAGYTHAIGRADVPPLAVERNIEAKYGGKFVKQAAQAREKAELSQWALLLKIEERLESLLSRLSRAVGSVRTDRSAEVARGRSAIESAREEFQEILEAFQYVRKSQVGIDKLDAYKLVARRLGEVKAALAHSARGSLEFDPRATMAYYRDVRGISPEVSDEKLLRKIQADPRGTRTVSGGLNRQAVFKSIRRERKKK